MHQGVKRERNWEGEEKKKEREADRRDEWIAEEPVVKQTPTPASHSSEVSPGFVFQMSMLAGVESALHNQQTLTSTEPKEASGSYGWTCRTNPMSTQNTSSYTGTSGRFKTETEGGDGKGDMERKNGTNR